MALDNNGFNHFSARMVFDKNDEKIKTTCNNNPSGCKKPKMKTQRIA